MFIIYTISKALKFQQQMEKLFQIIIKNEILKKERENIVNIFI